ncbi:MAG: corrinoid protein [Planctomycetota bacterium]|jgi:5-methyltetrahydrofolate--homocysteine methyltransferase
MELLEHLSEYLQKGEDDKVLELTKKALDENISPNDILNNGLIVGMNVVGEKFRDFEIFLPDVLLSAKAMTAAMDHLKPMLIQDDLPNIGKIVIGTVQGDLHDIGKNLVGIMLKGIGVNVIDLGKDVPPEKFVDTAVKEKADVIGMSALLTTSTPMMKKVVEILHQRGLNKSIKTIVGGAPLSASFAIELGADGYASDAADAVDRITQLFGEK